MEEGLEEGRGGVGGKRRNRESRGRSSEWTRPCVGLTARKQLPQRGVSVCLSLCFEPIRVCVCGLFACFSIFVGV